MARTSWSLMSMLLLAAVLLVPGCPKSHSISRDDSGATKEKSDGKTDGDGKTDSGDKTDSGGQSDSSDKLDSGDENKSDATLSDASRMDASRMDAGRIDGGQNDGGPRGSSRACPAGYTCYPGPFYTVTMYCAPNNSMVPLLCDADSDCEDLTDSTCEQLPLPPNAGTTETPRICLRSCD